MVPSPITGGGGNTAMNASLMPANLAFRLPVMASPDSSAPWRSANGLSVTNTMPALELLVKPLIDRPGKAMALSTPGSFRAMSDMRRITSSVRSSEAPLGSCAKPIRYCLSCAGTKPPGTMDELPAVAASSGAYTPTAPALRRMTPVTPVAYVSDERPKKSLNQLESRPNTRFMARVSQSGLSWWPLSSRADSAGDKVSELNAEITVEMAMVMANCL